MLNGFGCPDCGGTCAQKPMNGLGSYGKQIEWNTEPVINTYPVNRDGYWDCNDWMSWHKKVAAKYGVNRANEVFVIWWNKQGFWAYANSDCWIFNQSFRNYFKSVGLPLDALADFVSKPFDVIDKVSDSAGNVVVSAAKTAENAADTAKNTSATLKWLVPTIAIGAVSLVGFYLYKNYAKGNARVKVGKQTI